MSLKLDVKATNYGSLSKPNYTVEVELKASLRASPDEVHRACVEERFVSTRTVPTSPVVNFRGSMDGSKPYYRALVVDRGGTVYEYVVEARYKGGVSNVTYEPHVRPPSLRRLHPSYFKLLGFKVEDFEVNNYRFTAGLKRYEELHVEVYGGPNGGSSLQLRAREAGLSELRPPCDELISLLSRALERLGIAGLREVVGERVRGLG
ncbi:hypothetical protein B6U99_03465 [Candidatus Geothermarchaeota archaeon ex4572_27]|nr:MAG: hypothetical protein B6U99_03465 [Candidatus Geothermarchaeota archaeon ex4572_27]